MPADTLGRSLRARRSSTSWTGASWGLALALVAVVAAKYVDRFDSMASALASLLGVTVALFLALAGGLALLVLVRLAAKLPPRYGVLLAAGVVALSDMFPGTTGQRVLPAAFLVVVSSVAGASVLALVRSRAEHASRRRVLIAAASLGACVAVGGLAVRWLVSEGNPEAPAADASAGTAAKVAPIDAPDPGAAGSHRVQRLFYGSGNDRRRPEFAAGLRTRTFDVTRLLNGWTGFDGWARTKYWGFNARAVPIDGRVFYPEGDGPFPLVLAVHGAHSMTDFSDAGYDYLGEHLASHGFVFVSIDENFLNAAPWTGAFHETSPGVTGECAARGVLVLEHLRALRGFHEAPGTPLSGKIDLGKIGLVGHSRGGDAIATAALFNRLRLDPDDSSIRLDYGFGIRALAALSATDKLYRPAGVGATLRDIDFLALQGSHDGDNEFFQAAQQYDRVVFSGDTPHFKATVYVYRANHGQWSRVWGRHDKSRFPKREYLNREPFLRREEQERVARVYLTAFFSASLRGDDRCLGLFRDHRAGKGWLPETIFLTRFDDSTRRYVARFEEDVDLTTTTLPGGKSQGDHLTIWREQPPGSPSLWSSLESRSVYLGWDAARGGMGRYAIELPPDLGPELLGPDAALVFGLADANTARQGPGREPIDLTLELADGAGRVARVPLSSVRMLQPQLEGPIWKAKLGMKPRREVVFQTFEVPLSAFLEQEPELTPADVRVVRFVFNRAPSGLVVLDDVGFAPRVR